jgi:hypothetical protein
MVDVLRTDLPLRQRLFRRALHVSFGAVVLYYLFPKTILGLPTWILLVAFITIPSVIMELWRIKSHRLFYGLREHETHHVASYFWFVNGAVLLLIFFPQYIAAPCILATAIGDPVIGETRLLRRRWAFSIGFLVCFFSFLLFRYHWAFAAIAGLIAESMTLEINWEFRDELFYSRSQKKVSRYKEWFDFIFKTDDDLMMQLIPALFIFLCVLFFQANGFSYLVPPNNIISQLPWF